LVAISKDCICYDLPNYTCTICEAEEAWEKLDISEQENLLLYKKYINDELTVNSSDSISFLLKELGDLDTTMIPDRYFTKGE